MREKRKNIKLLLIILAIVLVVLIAVGVSVKASASNGIAKSVTFTNNMDGYYVYFRAVDSAGNAGEWSNAQRIWIDTTTPTVTAKENSVTIKEGDINALEDYFTVVANGTNADVDVVCTIGGVEYTTTETLTVDGSPYTVVCTATKNGGKSGNARMEIVVETAGPIPWDGTVATSFARGTGIETDPYIIETPQQLAYLASTTNAGTTYEGVYFKQDADLDLGGIQAADGTWSGTEWIPIGGSGTYFSGHFDGNNKTISNIYIDNSTSDDNQGLFGEVVLGDISNIKIVNGYIRGLDGVGGITGSSSTDNISNCSNGAEIYGESYVGGITGSAYCVDIANCSNTGDITGDTYVGGIVGSQNNMGFGGLANNNSNNCTNTGKITGNSNVGEIAGYAAGCFVAGTKIYTVNGLVNIEDIKLGDIVYSMNMETMEIEPQRVVNTMKNTYESDTCLISVGGNYIESTKGHNYYEKTKGWVEACQLKVGDILIDGDGNEKEIQDVQLKQQTQEIIVYNFEVEKNHNYFVGEDRILVHNLPTLC